MLRIGVDVGGTNTDAALLDGSKVLATVKSSTTADVTSGVGTAIRAVLAEAGIAAGAVNAVMIGTTHFLNAVVEGRHLETVGILRLCGASTRSLPPLIDWPDNLRDIVDGGAVLVDGGVNYDGSEIAPLDGPAIRAACREWKARGIASVAICSVFALVDPRMENEAAGIVAEEMPGAAISLSHRVGRTGLLPRENATVLNASLHRLGHETVGAFRAAFTALGLTCPLYLTQNDGTLMAAEFAERYPVFTIASGPTNSMRGAAFLTGLSDAAVIDIGGAREGGNAKVAGFEPVTLFSALAPFTTHLGFIATASTTYEEPYTTARKFASLDLISGGRAGWNVVTTTGDPTAQNFNRETQLPHAARYRRAAEHVDVVKKLWDSFEDDAFLRDKEAGVFFDQEKLHEADHRGEHFQVRGPLNVSRSPQGHPVIVQAGQSDDGRGLAAATAEVIFTAHLHLE